MYGARVHFTIRKEYEECAADVHARDLHGKNGMLVNNLHKLIFKRCNDAHAYNAGAQQSKAKVQ